MTEPLGLYPLSSIDGKPIPYEIIRPIGVIRQNFTDTPSPEVAIPEDADLLSVFATNICLMKFNGLVMVPASGAYAAGQILIPAYTIMNVDHNAAATFSVIGLADPGGSMWITTVQRWTDLNAPIRLQRG